MQSRRDMEAEGFKQGTIAGVVVRDVRKYVDERGWLAELFRHDQLEEEFYPQMGYISQSEPQVQRGPHEHIDQADLFCFTGPSNFRVRLWDNRAGSETYRNVMTLVLGEDDPKSLLVPKGVVHAYRNVGQGVGIVLNFPNRLFKGPLGREEVDEIRHEDDPETIYKFDD